MFRILDILASGSFGTVCVAERDGEAVALKVMLAEHLHNEKVMARIRDEARMLEHLHHPSIVEVQELLELNDRPVLVMEWVRGLSLEDLIERHPSGLPPAVAVEIVRRSCLALDHAWNHEVDGRPLHVIHRDIKPPNVLLSVEGRVKLLDFGIARAHMEDKEAETVSMVLGTHAFMAPERLDGDTDRPSGDVYAMGLVLYELLTGGRLLLSMALNAHKSALKTAMAGMSLEGVPDREQAAIGGLISSMCAYFEAERPTHAQVAQQLLLFLNHTGLKADLAAFARDTISPVLDARVAPPPDRHPAWPEVAFLDDSDPTTDDSAIRTWLQSDASEDQVSQLLRRHPRSSDDPFLEVLERASAPWWKFWTGSSPTSSIVASLTALTHRPTPRAVALAWKLREHPNPRVAERARTLIERGSGEPDAKR